MNRLITLAKIQALNIVTHRIAHNVYMRLPPNWLQNLHWLRKESIVESPLSMCKRVSTWTLHWGCLLFPTFRQKYRIFSMCEFSYRSNFTYCDSSWSGSTLPRGCCLEIAFVWQPTERCASFSIFSSEHSSHSVVKIPHHLFNYPYLCLLPLLLCF